MFFFVFIFPFYICIVLLEKLAGLLCSCHIYLTGSEAFFSKYSLLNDTQTEDRWTMTLTFCSSVSVICKPVQTEAIIAGHVFGLGPFWMHYRRVRPCSDLINAMSAKISCLEFFVQAVCDSCSRSADLPAV